MRISQNFFDSKSWLLIVSILGIIIFSSFIEVRGQVKSQLMQENLQSISFEDISALEAEFLEDEKLEKLDILTDFHLGRAKSEQNNLEIARAYYYKYSISDSEKALNYADSIIEITKEISHPDYPTIGYSLKGHYYYNSGKFELALDSYIKAYQLAIQKKNVEQQREISIAIAAVRNLTGQHYAALDLYTKALNLLQKEKNYKKDFNSEYVVLLYNLSLTQLRLKQIDSARIYASQGIEFSSQTHDKLNFRDFVLLDAQINYFDNNLQNSRDTLEKYVNDLDGTSKAIKLYYLGKIAGQLKNEEKAIGYFKKIDSIIKFTQDEFPEVKDVYHYLILDAIRHNEKEKQIEYIDKLVHYDSLFSI